MLMLLQVLIPFVIAIGAFFAVEPNVWSGVRSDIILVLSVLAAAVLFRLGRGIPPMNVEELELREVQVLAKEFRKVTRRLAIFLLIIVISLIGLSLAEVVDEIFLILFPEFSESVQKTIIRVSAAVLIFFIVLTFYRAFLVIRGDRNLASVQGEIMVCSAKRRQNRKVLNTANELKSSEKEQSFRNPSNYGKLIGRD